MVKRSGCLRQWSRCLRVNDQKIKMFESEWSKGQDV